MATTLSSIASSFSAKYKYKVAGKTDLLFSQIGQIVSAKDSTLKFNLFKTRRLKDVTTQNAIAADASLTAEQKNVNSAQSKVSFLSDATRTLKQNVTTTTSPRGIANAINLIAKELETAVKNYVAGRGGTSDAIAGQESEAVSVEISGDAAAASGGVNAEADQNFVNTINNLTKTLKALLLKQKGPLRMMGKYFDTNYYQAARRLDNIGNMITSFTTPAASSDAVVQTGTETTADTATTGEDNTNTAATVIGESSAPAVDDARSQQLDITV